MEKIKEAIKESIETKKFILNNDSLLKEIYQACLIIFEAYKNNKKTIFAGNGGSAADSQHLAAEFVSRFYFDRPGLSSIALTTDTSILTAIGNDYGFEKLFSRQIQANGEEGDVFIAISTSGTSTNILEALKTAKKKGLLTIGFTGQRKSEMIDLTDICIQVPSNCVPRIQECHILIGHIICEYVEYEIFGK